MPLSIEIYCSFSELLSRCCYKKSYSNFLTSKGPYEAPDNAKIPKKPVKTLETQNFTQNFVSSY